jgi:imidazolonepropionase-like amidohydrolase
MQGPDLTITNATALTPQGWRRGVTIIVKNGVITDITDSAGGGEPEATISAEGRFVIPGLINLHSHLTFFPGADTASDGQIAFRAAAQAREALLAGITTIRDIGGMRHIDVALRDAIASGDITGPRLRVSGKIICMTGGHTYPRAREADGPDDVRRAVREQVKAGADLIKFMASGGVARPEESPDDVQFTVAELQAGTDEAHRLNRPVAVHAHPKAAILAAIRAGVDFIEHATFLDQEVIDACLEADVTIVPTFCVYKRISASETLPRQMVENAKRIYDEKLRGFALALRSGVMWGVGLDNGTYYPPHDYVTELECLVEAGVTADQALHAATAGNAALLGMEQEVGSLSPSHFADLVVLQEDPLRNLEGMRAPDLVVKAGVPHRIQLPGSAAPGPAISARATRPRRAEAKFSD